MFATSASSALSNETLAVYAAQGIRVVIMSELRRQRITHFRNLSPPPQLSLLTPRPFQPEAAHFHTGIKAHSQTAVRNAKYIYLVVQKA